MKILPFLGMLYMLNIAWMNKGWTDQEAIFFSTFAILIGIADIRDRLN